MNFFLDEFLPFFPLIMLVSIGTCRHKLLQKQSNDGYKIQWYMIAFAMEGNELVSRCRVARQKDWLRFRLPTPIHLYF